MDDINTLKVSETFISIQGEGPQIGKKSYFLRLVGCNLACEWCDSKYTWQSPDFKIQSVKDIAQDINNSKVSNLVITGGEPLLQQNALTELVRKLISSIYIEVETNGTILPKKEFCNYIDQFNVSPKMSNSNNKYSMVCVDFKEVIDSEFVKILYKFVVTKSEDFKEIEQFKYEYYLYNEQIYIMPEGVNRLTQVQNMDWVVQMTMQYGFNFTPRLHILIWDNKRGV